MKKVFLMLIVMIGCTIEVPVDEIEVPPIENHTRIVVNIPDGLSVPSTSTPSDGEGEASDARCVYKHFPDYYSKYGAYVLGCTGDVDEATDFVCCTWVFPEKRQMCEERWCRDKYNKCGWKLNSWDCYSY